MMSACNVHARAPCAATARLHTFAPIFSARPCRSRFAQGCLHKQQHRGVSRLVQAIGSDPLAAPSQSGLSPELKAALDKFTTENKVVLFMKGTRQFPQCGFSNTCVQILNTLTVPYETVNILEDERLRSGMKEYSQWPTFPQVYIGGEFYGGCDIMIEGYQSGTLVEELEAALNS